MKNKKKIVYNYNPFITVYREDFKNKQQSRKNFHKIKLQNAAMVILKNEKNQILFLNEYRRGIKKNLWVSQEVILKMMKNHLKL